MSDYDNNSLQSLNDNERHYMTQLNDDTYSVVTDTSVDESIKKKPIKNRRNTNALYEEIKATDPGYHKIIRREDGVKLKTEVYSTSFIPGSMIRDAITGNRYHQYRVGSWHEDLFFKVKETSGSIGKEASILFYDSPEQFERHLKVNISNESKKNWTNKFARAQARVNAE
jgi:hypothetical protein|tara:strand:+ start:13338 stop:13847 length:510 start_codon:yes stop_codon:yes gene_type:complete